MAANLHTTSVVCIGAGPAGLTAAHRLSAQGIPVIVLERDPVYVGGISRTVRHDGFHFDIGGHRFFSKSAEVEAFWTEILGADMLERPRKSRISYRGKLFDYPLRIGNTLRNLGPFEAIACVASYIKSRLFPFPEPRNFEEWVTNRFGARLFRIFFKTYTEKVWGMKCSEISADWAAQRIKGLSLGAAIRDALGYGRSRPTAIKTLINRFRYPRTGPGMMWEAVAAQVVHRGGVVRLGLNVVCLDRDETPGKWTVTAESTAGGREVFVADHVISSAALKELVAGLLPLPPEEVRVAATSLRYRDFLIVALFVTDRGLFDDNWIYVHDPAMMVGRIQNFKSWSPEMVPDQKLNCFGMEYFCNEADEIWKTSDADLTILAKAELVRLGLATPGDVRGGYVIRQQKAYPVYDDHYKDRVATIRKGLEASYPGLHPVGRNGMHRYNNQDHAMMTAMLTARNIIAGKQVFDPWLVNEDAEYHESGSAGDHVHRMAPPVEHDAMPTPEKRISGR